MHACDVCVHACVCMCVCVCVCVCERERERERERESCLNSANKLKYIYMSVTWCFTLSQPLRLCLDDVYYI